MAHAQRQDDAAFVASVLEKAVKNTATRKHVKVMLYHLCDTLFLRCSTTHKSNARSSPWNQNKQKNAK